MKRPGRWHLAGTFVTTALLLCANSAHSDDSATSADASGKTLSDAERTWQELVARVPDLGEMGLLHPERAPFTRVPHPSEVAPVRRLCRYERDLQSSVMRRRCYTEVELSRLRRQSRVTSTMYVGGVRQ